MNRQEFLEKLRLLLGDLSEEEREEAIQYYEDYFADAGPEMEEQVIRELGSPEKVALMIREAIRGEEPGGEFAETGYSQSRYDNRDVPADYTRRRTGDSDSYWQKETGEEYRKPWTDRRLKLILIILIIIVGCSTVVPVVGGAVLGILGVIAGIFGVFIAFVIAAVCIVVAGVAVAIAGIPLMIAGSGAGLLVSGIGLLLLAAGVLGTAFSIRLCGVMIPAIFRIMVKIARRLIYRGKERA